MAEGTDPRDLMEQVLELFEAATSGLLALQGDFLDMHRVVREALKLAQEAQDAPWRQFIGEHPELQNES